MTSIKNFENLPDRFTLEKISKAISVLDAILCQEWQFRYYSFNSKWGLGEKILQMRNGGGTDMHILFRNDGSAINIFSNEDLKGNKADLTENLPERYKEFFFEEPIKSIGTTCCLWTNENNEWIANANLNPLSLELLQIFDGKPQTYIDWAEEYFEKENIPLETVQKIYDSEVLTKDMVLSIDDELEDWDLLEEDLKEIDYPFSF